MSLSLGRIFDLESYSLLDHILPQTVLAQALHALRILVARPAPEDGRLRAEALVLYVLRAKAVAEGIGEGVSVARSVVGALTVGDGEGIDIGLEVDDEAAEGGEGGAEDADVHHDSRSCKLLRKATTVRLNLLVPNTTINTFPWES